MQSTHTDMYTYTHTHTHIYVCVCVCVCVHCSKPKIMRSSTTKSREIFDQKSRDINGSHEIKLFAYKKIDRQEINLFLGSV